MVTRFTVGYRIYFVRWLPFRLCLPVTRGRFGSLIPVVRLRLPDLVGFAFTLHFTVTFCVPLHVWVVRSFDSVHVTRLRFRDRSGRSCSHFAVATFPFYDWLHCLAVFGYLQFAFAFPRLIAVVVVAVAADYRGCGYTFTTFVITFDHTHVYGFWFPDRLRLIYGYPVYVGTLIYGRYNVVTHVKFCDSRLRLDYVRRCYPGPALPRLRHVIIYLPGHLRYVAVTDWYVLRLVWLIPATYSSPVGYTFDLLVLRYVRWTCDVDSWCCCRYVGLPLPYDHLCYVPGCYGAVVVVIC